MGWISSKNGPQAVNYPGDLAEPAAVARWMFSIAQEEFGLPGILPVMCSCVELTDAWTGPGDVKNVPGYLYSVDFDSFGYFQQRPSQGWGTREQLINADYALRAFCREAVRLAPSKPYPGDATPGLLGEWCANVQRPRVDLRHLYTTKGYLMAKELLKEIEVAYPERKIAFSKNSWAYDLKTNEWIRAEPDLTLKTDANGWLYKRWEWPEAYATPQSSGTYVQRFPTRYFWRPDVEEVARKVIEAFPGQVWANTYWSHPPGWNRDVTSIDFWGYGGRGHAIDPAVRTRVYEYVFNDPNPPHIEWLIVNGWIWTYSGGWRRYEDYDQASDGQHVLHIHTTYF